MMFTPRTFTPRTFNPRCVRDLALACVAVSNVLCACAGRSDGPDTPETTVVAFARALSEGKLAAAYALMSADYRKRVSFEDWEKMVSENSQEVVETSNALSHVRGPASKQASLDYQGKGDLVLVQSGERWFIASDLARFYDQSSPRSALRAFVRALERKRYDVLLRLVPNADREGMTTASLEQTWGGSERDQIERLLNNLRNNLEQPIEVVGNHATLPYGQGMRVQFVREDGAWKIEDPE
jgi:hypothetical protein